MKIANLPENSGVYIFKDSTNKPIYIGKALNIKKRVRDHLAFKGSPTKEAFLMDKVSSVEAIQVDSEIEALILEANLIKKFKPIYNSQLRDDKDFLYIKITKDNFPKVAAVRKKHLKDAKTYFGPFPSAQRVRTTLKTLRKIFPYSTCQPPPAGRAGDQKRPCFYYHLGLCPGVCVGEISEEGYRKNIKALILFLQGRKSEVFKSLERDQKNLVSALKFEEAADRQRKLDALNYITKPTRRIEALVEDLAGLREKELEDLATILGLTEKPARIECYDVSNISGSQAVGSMVVFTNGQADHDEYRRFRIKTVYGISDIAMMTEIMERRFGDPWPLPDLVIVDGGKGQLNAAFSVIKKLKLQVSIIALAKRVEEIFLFGKKTPLRLSFRSDALKLVQRIRDEAHRFAINYHRKLRAKEFLTT